MKKFRLFQNGGYVNRFSWRHKVARCAWELVWLLLFRPTPRWLFYGWRRRLLVCFGAKIPKGASIHPSVKVWAPWNLTCDVGLAIAAKAEIYSVDRITLGACVTISQGAYLCCASHDITSTNMELIYLPITVKDNAWIAARAFIGPGVTVGEGAVVGACAVVTKDVEPWTVVAGNPAKKIKNRTIQGFDHGPSFPQ